MTEQLSRNASRAGVAAAYAGAAVVTVLLGRTFATPPRMDAGLLVPVSAGLALLVACDYWFRRGWTWTRPLEIAAAGLLILGVASVVGGWRPALAYGDSVTLAQCLTKAYAFPRWLLGTTALIVTHRALQLPELGTRIPELLLEPMAFLSLAGTASMAIGSLAILRRWPGRLAAALPMLTPVWVLFSTGYVEYYPFIAPAIVAVLLWILDRPLESRDPRVVGAIAGLLPVLYVGLAGLSLLLVCAYVLARPRAVLATCGVAALTAAVLVAICWPQGIVSYLARLAGEISVGDQHVAFPRYQFRSASEQSILFATSYVISGSHLRDLAYMAFWAHGWPGALPLVAGGVLAARQMGSRRSWRVLADARAPFAIALVVWQVFYFLFMIPRLGPTIDIDLFFVTYLAVSCIGGWLLDRTLRPSHRIHLLAVLIAVTAVTAYLTAWVGLPLRT